MLVESEITTSQLLFFYTSYLNQVLSAMWAHSHCATDMDIPQILHIAQFYPKKEGKKAAKEDEIKTAKRIYYLAIMVLRNVQT